MIKQYDKVKLTDGRYAVIVEVLEPQKAFIADVELSEGDYDTETVLFSDISALIVEVEQPLVHSK